MKHKSLTVMRSGMVPGLYRTLCRSCTADLDLYSLGGGAGRTACPLCEPVCGGCFLGVVSEKAGNHLCGRYLPDSPDALMSGRQPEGYRPYEDSVTARVQRKLIQYFDIMNEGKIQSQKDKETIQGLVSDISHQVKDAHRQSAALYIHSAESPVPSGKEGGIHADHGGADQ